MTKPVTIPNTFATATTAIPLSQLDSDFSTVATALNDANTYSNYAADTGVANAYVVTLTGVSTTYSAGLRIQFKAGNANTGASTLNVNGGGTKNITFQDASALSSGTIAANAIVDVMYDGTQFLLMNDPAGTVGTGDVVGPAGATANAAAIFDSTTGKLIKDSKVIITPVANSSTLTIANNKTVTVNNTLTLSGTDSTTMTFPSTSATIARTDSAQTFTGVQTFSSNPVLNGGTANGVLYLNGSRVATSGSALTFDGSTQALAASGYGVYRVSGGSAGGGYFETHNNSGTRIGSFGSENGGDMYLGTRVNNPIIFLQNNSEAMRLTSTGLGIGTSSPSQRLEASFNDATTNRTNPVNVAAITATSISSAGAVYNGFGPALVFRSQSYNGTVYNGSRVRMVINDNSVQTTQGASLAFDITNTKGGSPVEAMLLDFNGNLGIGTSSPSSILDVQKAGTAASTTDLLELTNSGNAASMTNTGTGILFNQFYYDATTPAVADAGRIAVKTEGNWTSTASTQDAYMTFETALDGTVAERARITSGGVLDLATGAGAVGQIQFPATQVASSNANTLDDYEEGTWTPTNAGDATGTLSFATGEYVKVGRMVYLRGVVDISVNFTGNSLGGLPFTPSGNTATTSLGPVNIVMNNGSANLAMGINIDTSRLVFYTDNSTANTGGLTTTNDVLRFSITYQASA